MGSRSPPSSSAAMPDPEVKNSKMDPKMEATAKGYVMTALKRYTLEKEVAEYVKTKCDKKFGPKWHCIVGRHFASYVAYEPQHYIYMKVGEEVSYGSDDVV